MLRRLAVGGSGGRCRVRGLEEFFDGSAGGESGAFRTGRSWRASELRLKSFEDLHKLWFVLLKEKNKLLTERRLAKTMQTNWANPERLGKVRISMARLKTVATERTKVHALHKHIGVLRTRTEDSLEQERRKAEIEEMVANAKVELNIDELLEKYKAEVEIPRKQARKQATADKAAATAARLQEEMDEHPDYDIDNLPDLPEGLKFRQTMPKSPRRVTFRGK